jgi:hypothetical protein
MDAVQSKMTFGVVDKRPLLCVILGNPFVSKMKTLNDSVAVKLPFWWVQPSNSTNQLNFGTLQTFKNELKPTIASAIELFWRTVLVAT